MTFSSKNLVISLCTLKSTSHHAFQLITFSNYKKAHFIDRLLGRTIVKKIEKM